MQIPGGKPGAWQVFQSQQPFHALSFSWSPKPLGMGLAPRPGLSPPRNILTCTLRLRGDGRFLHRQMSVMLWLGMSRKAALIVEL